MVQQDDRTRNGQTARNPNNFIQAMSVQYSKCDFHFGLGYPNKLPDGWILLESKDAFAMALFNGQRYFLGEGKAYPAFKATREMAVLGLTEGEEYVELETGVVDLA